LSRRRTWRAAAAANRPKAVPRQPARRPVGGEIWCA
jgi:hypothetical protein